MRYHPGTGSIKQLPGGSPNNDTSSWEVNKVVSIDIVHSILVPGPPPPGAGQ